MQFRAELIKRFSTEESPDNFYKNHQVIVETHLSI